MRTIPVMLMSLLLLFAEVSSARADMVLSPTTMLAGYNDLAVYGQYGFGQTIVGRYETWYFAPLVTLYFDVSGIDLGSVPAIELDLTATTSFTFTELYLQGLEGLSVSHRVPIVPEMHYGLIPRTSSSETFSVYWRISHDGSWLTNLSNMGPTWHNYGTPLSFVDGGGEGVISFQIVPTWTQFGSDSGEATLVVHDATLRVVPEPGTMVLLALGGLAVLRRRRK